MRPWLCSCHRQGTLWSISSYGACFHACTCVWMSEALPFHSLRQALPSFCCAFVQQHCRPFPWFHLPSWHRSAGVVNGRHSTISRFLLLILRQGLSVQPRMTSVIQLWGWRLQVLFLCLVYGVRGLKTGTVCMLASTLLTIPQPPSLSSSSYWINDSLLS